MPASRFLVSAFSTGKVLPADFMYYTYMRVRTPPAMSRSAGPPRRPRSTQTERRARSRAALLESAARGLSRYGYGNLVLEQVAREAGYTRGALYHQFKDKEELTLAVLEWVNETWWREVGTPAEQQPDPVAALLALARGHAVYCRRDVARVMMALRVEFSGQDHPVGREIKRVSRTLMKRCARLIEAGRKDGSIPPGPPAKAVALAFWGALEGAVIALAGHAPHDELLAARAVAGVLGLASPPLLPSPDLAPSASGASRPVSQTPPHAPGRSNQLH
jgi:AcrR family transcriptional regulator